MPGYKEHLFIGFIASTAISILISLIFKINLLETNLLKNIIIVTLIFSVLPDIDHKSSNVSWFLHFISVVVILMLITKTPSLNYSMILIIISLVGLEIYHWSHAKNNYTHRQFPHTFTFGLFSSLVLFLISFSWFLTLIGIIIFSTHILADNHLNQALEEDKLFWVGIRQKFFSKKYN